MDELKPEYIIVIGIIAPWIAQGTKPLAAKGGEDDPAILNHSGYGSVTITLEKGHIDELAMRVTAIPRQKKPF